VASVSTFQDARAFARWPAVVVLLSATCSYIPLVQAGSWQEYAVKDRLGTVVGRGIEFRGMLDRGYGTREVFLTSECVGGKTIVRIEVRRYDFGVWPVIVRWRVDHSAEHMDTWHPCDGGTCIGLWEGQGEQLLNNLRKASFLGLRIEGRYDKPITAKFDVQGAGGDLESAGRQCGWA